MPAQPQANLAKDPLVIKAMDRYTDRHFGVNLTVIKSGAVKVGDPVFYETSQSGGIKDQLAKRSDQLKNLMSQRLLDAVDRFSKR